MSGKGSRPRPYSVDRKTFDANWDRIFGKKKRENALDELANLSQKMGFYDDIEDVEPKHQFSTGTVIR